MKTIILAIGSRGDVQPYIALGLGLTRYSGHHVTIAAVAEFEPLVRQYGLDFVPVAGDVSAMLRSEAAFNAMESGTNTLKAIRQLIKMIEPDLMQQFESIWALCQGTDLILTSTLGVVGYPIGQKLGVPVVSALPYPLLSPTHEFPNPAWPFANRVPGTVGGAVNLLSHYVAEQIAWQPFKGLLHKWMKNALDLEPYPFFGPFRQIRQAKGLILYGYSPHVIPKPTNWGRHEVVTGYWFVDPPAAYQPPQALVDFIEAGSKPLYVGFGSMIDREPERLLNAVASALDETGQRAVLLSGWAGLAAAAQGLSAAIYTIDSVPHSWLFPQMSTVIHHGGAGTTAAGLRAGIPSILTPFFGDQPFWARIIHERGVGPEPVPAKKLSRDALVPRIERALGDQAMRHKAAQLGEQIRAEDGVRRAAETVNAFIDA